MNFGTLLLVSIYVYNCCIFLMDWLLYHYKMSLFPVILFVLKCIFFWYQYSFQFSVVITSDKFSATFSLLSFRYSHYVCVGMLNDIPHFSEMFFIFPYSFFQLAQSLSLHLEITYSLSASSNHYWSSLVKSVISLWFFFKLHFLIYSYIYSYSLFDSIL